MQLEHFRRLLALWQEDCLTDDQLVEIADKAILAAEKDTALPHWLTELSLHGPADCISRLAEDCPEPESLTFQQRFSLRAATLDLNDTQQVEHFAIWAARHCLGEDFDLPEVLFAYQLGDMFDDCVSPNLAVEYVQEELPEYLPNARKIAGDLLQDIL